MDSAQLPLDRQRPLNDEEVDESRFPLGVRKRVDAGLVGALCGQKSWHASTLGLLFSSVQKTTIFRIHRRMRQHEMNLLQPPGTREGTIMKTVSATVPVTVKAEVATVLAEHGISMTAFVRQLLTRVAARDAETLAWLDEARR